MAAELSASAGAARRYWRWGGRLLGGVLSLALTLLGLLLFTFMLSHLAPIDSALQVAGDHASEATYAQVRHELGLDLPLPVQFWRYLVHLAHGDLGISRITAQPVLSDLLRTFRRRWSWPPAPLSSAPSAALRWRFWRCSNQAVGWITRRVCCR